MAEREYYLNLQEQVGKNKRDIADLKTVNYQLATVGVKIVGQEEYAENLPDPLTYGGDLGDAYMVGTEAPFHMYIYTRPAAGQTANRWFDIGEFPLRGPIGPNGPQGPQGPQGVASKWRADGVNPTILDTDRAGDLYLNTTTGMVYQFDGTYWIAKGTIKGAQGPQGPIGPEGPQGRQGNVGPRGPQGPVGESFQVVGVFDTVGSLPDPAAQPRNAAYIIDDGVEKDLYIVVLDEDEEPIWYNAGPFLGIAAGFASPTATATALPANTPPTATVTATGPDNAKVFSFTFGIPVAYDLENTDATAPSTTLGYTQNVISKRTYKRVFKSLAEIFGNNAPASAYLTDIMAAMSDSAPCKAILVNYTGNKIVSDAPDQAEVEITIGNSTYGFNNAKCSAGSNYYLLTGFDYDDQLDQAVAHWDRIVTEETLPSSGGGYMPNLLINPDFKINQRGKSSYTGDNAYTVDRWCKYGSTSNVEVYTSGVGVSNTGAQTITLVQKMPFERSLAGKKVTLSAQAKIGQETKFFTCTATVPNNPSGQSSVSVLKQTESINAVKLEIRYNDYNGELWVVISWGAYASGTINWVKLELGETATPFYPPDKGEELSKCQYYYLEIQSSNYTFCLGAANANGSGGDAYLAFPRQMRNVPSMSIKGNWTVIAMSRTSAPYYENVNINTGSPKGKSSVMVHFSTSGLSPNEPLLLTGQTQESALMFDAEIY